MNRADLLRAADLACAATDSATIAASYDRIKPERADHFARLAEEGLYAALDALAQARMTDRRPDWFAVAADITQPMKDAA